MKYQTISAYMANKERYVPEDSGEVVVQPNLSLSLREILDRWAKEMPLDIMTRSGSFMLNDIEPDETDFDAEDIDLMDPVEQQEYFLGREAKVAAKMNEASQRSRKQDKREVANERSEEGASSDGDATETAE